MPNASRDQNSVPTLLGVSNVDGVTPVTIYADPVTHRLLVDLTGVVAVPGGANTDVQYNDAGTFGGDSGFTYDKAGSATLTETMFAENLGLEDTDSSNYLVFAAGSNLSANRLLTFVTGDAARTITLSGNPTLSDWFDQSVKQAATPVFAGANLSSGTTTLGTVAGSIDMTGATFLKIPNSNTPVVNANGEICIDNSVTDFAAGVVKYYSTAEMGVVAMPLAQFTSPQDGYHVAYNATTDGFELVAASASGANTALSNLASVSINTSLLAQTGVDLGSTTKPFRDAYLWGSGTYATTYIKLTGTPTSTRTLTLPDATDTLIGKATTDALTNKTFNTASTGNVFQINGTGITAVTGTGSAVLATSPTLVTPILGVATATSINFGGTTLANYVEGTFTPTVTLNGGSGNVTPVYTTNTGRYTRVGNRVFINIYLAGDGGAEGAGSGFISITLPIASSANWTPNAVGIIGIAVNAGVYYQVLGNLGSSATDLQLQYFTSISAISNFTGAQQNNTDRLMRFNFVYEV